MCSGEPLLLDNITMQNNYNNFGCSVYQYQIYIIQHHRMYRDVTQVHFTSVDILDIPSSLIWSVLCKIAALFTWSQFCTTMNHTKIRHYTLNTAKCKVQHNKNFPSIADFTAVQCRILHLPVSVCTARIAMTKNSNTLNYQAACYSKRSLATNTQCMHTARCAMMRNAHYSIHTTHCTLNTIIC